MNLGAVEDAFDHAVSDGVFPGAVVLVGRGEEVVFEGVYGFRTLVPEKDSMSKDAVFDLASLTKPLATTTAIMLLVKEGKVHLDDQITRFIPDFGVFGKSRTTFRHVLAHCSGLAAWKPYYEQISKSGKNGGLRFVTGKAAQSFIFERIHRERPIAAPGVRAVYSDLGFMLLSEVVEQIGGRPLDRFCHERIFEPLGLRSTFFVDLTQWGLRRDHFDQAKIAATENCPWRKKILCGEVHDENAYAMGGVAGHAGLFSSAQDIHRFIVRLGRCYEGNDPFLPQSIVREFLARDRSVEETTFALGWDTPSSRDSSSGNRFSPMSVGHLGFTGVSLWWDLERNCHIILLTNRIHPARNCTKIREFRPFIHNLILKALFS